MYEKERKQMPMCRRKFDWHALLDVNGSPSASAPAVQTLPGNAQEQIVGSNQDEQRGSKLIDYDALHYLCLVH
jgi:hypothetical protein